MISDHLKSTICCLLDIWLRTVLPC